MPINTEQETFVLRKLDAANLGAKFKNRGSILLVKEILGEIRNVEETLKRNYPKFQTNHFEIERLTSLINISLYKNKISQKRLRWAFDTCVDAIHFRIIHPILTQLAIQIK